MEKTRIAALICTAGMLVYGTTQLVRAEAAKPKYTVSEIMKALHKGDDNIAKRASKGQGTKEELAKMVDYYTALPLNEPPRGDKAAWEKKANALLKATKSLQKGEPGGLEAYQQAVNCKACHSEHKPEQKK